MDNYSSHASRRSPPSTRRSPLTTRHSSPPRRVFDLFPGAARLRPVPRRLFFCAHCVLRAGSGLRRGFGPQAGTRPYGLLFVILSFCHLSYASLPDGFNHSEYTWYELVTPHFRVIYHDGQESASRVVARTAESIFERVTREVGATPTERTPIIVAEYTTRPLEFATQLEHQIYLIGNVINDGRLDRDSWLEHLITHEFTHICIYWAMRGGPQGYTREYVAGPLIPTWLQEGIAEGAAIRWNIHGGYAILRAAVLEGTLPNLAEMDTFDFTDIQDVHDLTEIWLLYAVGQSMVAYMVENWGRDVVPRLLVNFRRFPIFDRALHQTIGITSKTLYHRWKQWVRDDLEQETAGRRPLAEYSQRLPVALQYPFGARWSPDGKKVALLGMEHGEEFQVEFFVANADGSGLRDIEKDGDVDLYGSARFSWSPDSRYLAFAARYAHTNGYESTGIWVWDYETDGTTRITGELKAVDPAWSPDGKTIAFVLYEAEGATSRIALMDPDGANLRVLTHGPGMPDNSYAPEWSPDGSRIVFEVVEHGLANLAMINADGTGYEKLTDDATYNRSPAWSPKGDRIAFTSYRDGINQVYTLNVQDRTVLKHTDEGVGTAYDPTWTPDGQNLTCILFRSKVAEIRTFPADHTEPMPPEPEPEGPVSAPAQDATAHAEMGRSDNAPEGPVSAPAQDATAHAEMGRSDNGEEVDTSTWTTQVYHSSDYIRIFLARPNFVSDPFGQGIGLRVFAEDPLKQQQFAADIGYGINSRRQNWTVEYLNSKNRANIQFRAFDRLRTPRPFETVAVVDSGQGVSVRTIYQRVPGGSSLYREEFRAGLSAERITPFAPTGPTVGAPSGGQLGILELGYERRRMLPAEGNARVALTYRGALPQPLGGLAFQDLNAVYEYTKSWSGRRRLLTGSIEYRNIIVGQPDSPALSGAAILPRVTYHQRFSDDKLSGAWPVFYGNRFDWEMSWEYLVTQGSRVFNRPDGHRLRAEIQNNGWVTRAARYQLRAGVLYDLGAAAPEFFVGFALNPQAIFKF